MNKAVKIKVSLKLYTLAPETATA